MDDLTCVTKPNVHINLSPSLFFFSFMVLSHGKLEIWILPLRSWLGPLLGGWAIGVGVDCPHLWVLLGHPAGSLPGDGSPPK
jgi:hypothetical protein